MKKKIIFTESAPKAIGPYSQAVNAGSFTFVSGQVAIHPETGDLMNQSIEQQAEQVIKNLTAICDEANASLDNIVKLTIYITDMNDFSVVNEVMQRHFKEPYPARATVEVSALPLGVNVEMDAILINND
ncbi:MAG: RidA family protein [SAR86 cluster bacterium]|jgi:2-iminobutanoate/2-iminopropanoate deaminase|uniref:RidA family protein n=1 Tax=SAR86 cluster bacterium TaxID=2030880 RepID=A0A937I569_9GAMM|nr:RidA family protein [SAR86 cluster bacterium]